MKTLFWFKRDLRIEDNTALYHALSDSNEIKAVFVFNEPVDGKLNNQTDRRSAYVLKHVLDIKKRLRSFNIELAILYGDSGKIIPEILSTEGFQALYFNEDYEPETLERDRSVVVFCNKKGIKCNRYCDHLIFKPGQIMNKVEKPYTVYTPFNHAWKNALQNTEIPCFDIYGALSNFGTGLKKDVQFILDNGSADLQSMDYSESFARVEVSPDLIKKYAQNRDYPALEGTSLAGVHLRYGTISIREAVRIGLEHSKIWLDQLIWREFFIHIMFHYPYVVNSCFQSKYDRLPWENDERLFLAWISGKTGFPLVDAGMRELKSTGFMHNRVRMNVASFLTKYLLIDWRWGEAYFFQTLMDYELASNNGNWQWTAGTGVDAAPYFRIFNPFLQARKFDPGSEYIKKWIPELGTDAYPAPVIDVKEARERCLKAYKSVSG